MKPFYPIILLISLLIIHAYPQTAEKGYKKYAKCTNQNNKEKAQKFIRKGFDINSRDAEGKTPFLYSLLKNKPDFAIFLLNAGANINLTDYRGNTCLHYAIENCKPDSIVYLLIEKGVNYRTANNQGYTPFHFSILFSCPELPFYLINKKAADFYLTTGLNESALHLSIEAGCDTLSLFLIEHDIDIRQPNNRGNTPLLTAMDFQRDEIAVKLIEMGANINVWNKDSIDALFFAVVNQEAEIAKLLLEKGAKIKRPQNHEPLIDIAANQENAEITELLLRHGACISDTCTTNDMCFTTAYINFINAQIVPDTVKVDYYRKSLNNYSRAKEKYYDELNDVRTENTGKFIAEVFLIAAAAATDTYYDPGFDYEAERRYYLKDQIERCNTKIAEIEKILENLNKQEPNDLPASETNTENKPETSN